MPLSSETPERSPILLEGSKHINLHSTLYSTGILDLREIYLDIPKEVMDYYQSCGMTTQQIQEAHRQKLITYASEADILREVQALITELEGQSKQT